jgi:hypothetical protein
LALALPTVKKAELLAKISAGLKSTILPVEGIETDSRSTSWRWRNHSLGSRPDYLRNAQPAPVPVRLTLETVKPEMTRSSISRPIMSA